MEQSQREWMNRCGGDYIGYIAHYGDPSYSEAWSGDGGAAIYNADMTVLERFIKNVKLAG